MAVAVNAIHQIRYERRSDACICGKHMIEGLNDGTCLWCGHGRVKVVVEHAYANMMRNKFVGSAVRIISRRQPTVKTATRPNKWTEETVLDAAQRFRVIHGRVPTYRDWEHADGFHHPCWVTVHRLFGGAEGFRRAMAEIPMERTAA